MFELMCALRSECPFRWHRHEGVCSAAHCSSVPGDGWPSLSDNLLPVIPAGEGV